MADFYVFNLKAGQDFQAAVAGKLIVVDDTGQANGVDITPMLNNSQGRTMPARKKAFKCWVDYDAVILRAAVDTTVSMFLASKDVSLGFADGALVNVAGEVKVNNDPTARIPVEIGGSTVNVTADNVGINNTDANPIPVKLHASDDTTSIPTTPYQAQAVTNGAPVAVAAVAGVLIAAGAARRGVRVKNVGANAVAIGGAGLTFANAAIVIQPGETWNENEAAAAAWSCICDAGLASTLNIQTIA